MGDVLRVSLIQTDVVWEDKRANLNKYAAIRSHITGDCDLVVFPEMFTTGFSMRSFRCRVIFGEYNCFIRTGELRSKMRLLTIF